MTKTFYNLCVTRPVILPLIYIFKFRYLGRSPRMQYHALSLLEAGFDVTLIGYDGEDLIPSLDKYFLPFVPNNNNVNWEKNALPILIQTINSDT